MMENQEKRYTGEQIVVRYNRARCIHAAACVRGLPAVFDPQRRPWIMPQNASADAIAEVVQRCPTGALHFERLDGAPEERPDEHASIAIRADGPLYLRGDLTVQRPDGTTITQDSRMALCRCGRSGNKPFCDNSHQQGFQDAGHLPEATNALAAESGPLTITVTERGPYRLSGSFTIQSADRSVSRIYRQASLCRCGASGHKPFCDGSHKQVPEVFDES